MNKLIAVVAIAAMTGACNSAKNVYTLTGTVDTVFNGKQVYLLNGEKRDSAIVENGAFAFKGQIDTPVLARVAIKTDQPRGGIGGVFVLEPGAPTVVLSEEGAVCAGTPLNDTYNAYSQKYEALYKTFRESYEGVRNDATKADAEKEAEADALHAEYAAACNVEHEALFSANPDNALGALAMMRLARNAGREKFDSLYNLAGGVVRGDDQVVNAKLRFENLEKTAEGKMFTDFTVEHGAADGSAVSLSDYVGKGKYVLVDFWASWCGPCRGEMPNLAEVYKKYKSDKFEIVGIAVWDKRKDTEKALESLPISWPVIFEGGEEPTKIYGIDGIPQIILFGPDGTIVARDLRGEKVGEKVGECLAQ